MVSPTILKRAVPLLLRLAYGATVAFVLWMVLGHYVPGQGLTALLFIGDKPVAHAIAPLQEYRPYTYPDGRIDTGVSRVVGITFEVDFSVKGY